MQGFDELTVNLEKARLEYANTLMDFKRAEKEGLKLPGFENLLKEAEKAEKLNLVIKALESMSDQINSMNPDIDSGAGRFAKLSNQLGQLENSIYNAGQEFEPFLSQLQTMKQNLDSFELSSIPVSPFRKGGRRGFGLLEFLIRGSSV